MADLIADCTVRIQLPNNFGSGFFVAPGMILTCAHVVADADEVTAVWRDRRLPGRVRVRIPQSKGPGRYYGLPDIALVTVAETDHPVAAFADPADPLPPRTNVDAHGFSAVTTAEPDIARDVRTLTIGGAPADDCLRIIGDTLPDGMSGSMLIGPNGRVCGFVKASTDLKGVLATGGWVVPVAAIARHLPDLLVANERSSTAWREQSDLELRYLRGVFATDSPKEIKVERERVPSYYLDPRRRFARFLPRPELATLVDWCQNDTSHIVRVLEGPGGAGKTRLSVELVELVDQLPGWTAGRLVDRPKIDLARLAKAITGRKVLLCVDFAEDWSHALVDLLGRVPDDGRSGIRVLLLARTLGAWWNALREAREVIDLVAPDPLPLPPLGRAFDPLEIITRAYQDFRSAVHPDAPAEVPDVLTAGDLTGTNVLGLHALALSVVLHIRDNNGALPDRALDFRHPLFELVVNELGWWRIWLAQYDAESDRDRVLLVPALYLATDDEQGAAVFENVLRNGGYDADLPVHLVETMKTVYPTTKRDGTARAWAPLQPDGLSETHILKFLGEAPNAATGADRVCAIFAAGVDESQAEYAVLVLARAAGLAAPVDGSAPSAGDARARQRATECIRVLIERYPDPLLVATVAVAAKLPAPTELIRTVRSCLRSISGPELRTAAAAVPKKNEVLAPLEAALWERHIEVVLAQSRGFTANQELTLAGHYLSFSRAAERAKDPVAALTAVTAAVERYRHVTAEGPYDVRAELASARLTFARLTVDRGRKEDALEPLAHVINTCQDLIREGESHERTLAEALRIKERVLRDLGRTEEATETRQRWRRVVAAIRSALLATQVSTEGANAPRARARQAPGDSGPQRLMFPVGHFAGPMYTSLDTDGPESFEVRFSSGVFSLSVEEYAVWAVTHGDPNVVRGGRPTDRATIARSAQVAGVETPEPLIDSLLDDGLLVELPVQEDEVRAFARHHQLVPLALGLGNSPQNPAEFQIGLPNAARVAVGYDVYHMWLFTHRWATLWDAVTAMAKEAAEANEEERGYEGPDKVELMSDADSLLRVILASLPVLVATSCVYIDRVD